MLSICPACNQSEAAILYRLVKGFEAPTGSSNQFVQMDLEATKTIRMHQILEVISQSAFLLCEGIASASTILNKTSTTN